MTDRSSRPDGADSDVSPEIKHERHPVQRFLKVLGPGLITGASDDDPSGIGTYAVAGASFGFSILWTAFVTFPMMTIIQYICAKIGMVTGMGLARVLRKNYSKRLVYPAVGALVIANTINAGTDIGAIGAALNLLVPIPIAAGAILATAAILALQVWGSYRFIIKIFKWLTLALLAYIASAFFAKPNLRAVLYGTFVPTLRLDSAFLTQLVAILGTTISPYLFFWQASHEVADEISMGRRTLRSRQGATDMELKYAGWDVTTGMLFSNVVMYFIILSTAAALFQHGKTDIQSAAEAAQALRPIAGSYAYLLFALGLIGAGFLGVPVLTGSSAYAISEVFGWKHGLDEKPRHAKLFYASIVIPTLIGTGIEFLGINPIRALFWTAVINGFLAPPLLVVLMFVSNNRTIMGDRVNGHWANALGWLTTLLMLGAAVALVFTWGK